MSLKNETWNQHYISQSEQRLNAIPIALNKKAKRIYALEIVDRETHTLRVKKPNGESVRKSLAFRDLFTFDVIDAKYRRNLESHFQRYEQDVGKHSSALLAKLRANQGEEIKTELVSLLSAKMMNFARNPFCINKMLNTYGEILRYDFRDEDLKAEFDLAMRGARPQLAAVCSRFGISEDQYNRWLRILFMLFAEAPAKKESERSSADPTTATSDAPCADPFTATSDAPSAVLSEDVPASMILFENTIKGLFESNMAHFSVLEYDTNCPEHVCVLSDRGLIVYPVTLSSGAVGTAFEFNISSHAFASFVTFVPDEVFRHVRRPAAAANAARGNVHVVRYQNKLDVLATYNQRAAYYSAERVLSASPRPHGLTLA